MHIKNKYSPINNEETKYFSILVVFSKIIRFSPFFIFIVVYFLFFLSLEKCFEGEKICSKKSGWIRIKLNEALISCFLLSLLFELMTQKIISKLHLIHVIIVFILFYLYSHGMDFDDHGLFNLLCFLSLLIIVYFIFVPFNILLYIIKKRNKSILLIYLIFLIIIIFFSFSYFMPKFLGCEGWQKGLNNTYIENDNNNSCRIKTPKYCPYKLISYILDFTKIARIKCGYPSEAKRKLLEFSKSKYINEKTKRIGFPMTNGHILFSDKSNRKKSFSNIIRNNLIDMYNLELLEKIKKINVPEITVDFSENPNGKMLINLHFNKSLSSERKIIEKNYHPYSNNIMVLYFDSISRVNGIRQLKKTLSFFEKFMSYNLEKFHSFQFFKYHAFKFYTPGNYPKLFFDIYRKKRKRFRITYYLKKYGYVTGFTNDMCSDNPYSKLMTGLIKEELCDHEFLLCDPNTKHINAMTKRCLYEKTNIDYQFEYGLQFWNKYKNNRKFFMLVNNDGHESTLEVIKYDDDNIFNFLNKLYNENLLEDTTIFLLSDHGCSLPTVYYFNEFFQIEKHLPMLFIMTKDKENQSYYQQYNNIYNNQQKFITAYDIYNTLCYLMLGNNYYKKKNRNSNQIFQSNLGINLFDSININRSPRNYEKMEQNICI